MVTKFNMKNMRKQVLLVPFVAVLTLLVASFAVAGEVAFPSSVHVEFNDIDLGSNSGVVGDVGDTVPVRVTFKAVDTTSDVKVKVRMEGHRDDVSASTSRFDVVAGGIYTKLLTLDLPSDSDDLTKDYTFYVEIVSSTDKTEEAFLIKMQRNSYTLEILSVDYNTKISAGDSVPVTVVAKNNGFNRADDNYVVVRIPALGVSARGYMGDLVAVEDGSRTVSFGSSIFYGDVNMDGQVTPEDRDDLTAHLLAPQAYPFTARQKAIGDVDRDGKLRFADVYALVDVLDGDRDLEVFERTSDEVVGTHDHDDDDEEDSVEKTVYLNIPSNAQAGVYEVEVEVYNEDSSVVTRKLVSVDESGSTMVLSATKTKDLSAGETATYEVVVVNSADTIRTFSVSALSGDVLDVSVPSIVVVGPNSDETVLVEVTAANDADEGSYTFTVDVDGEQVVFGANVTEGSSSASVVALTVILAIIFVVLLAVLIVLLTRREKSIEEVETSYY